MIDIPSPVAESSVSVSADKVKVEPEVEANTVVSQESTVCVKPDSSVGNSKNKRKRVHSNSNKTNTSHPQSQFPNCLLRQLSRNANENV